MREQHKAGEDSGREYNRAAKDFAKTDKGERAAEEAKRAVEGAEGRELRKAEEKGRAPANGRGK